MRALITTSGGHGHFVPLLPIAESLIARGHRVAFAVPDDFGAVVEKAGFTALPLPSPTRAPAAGGTSARGRAVVERYLEQAVRAAPHLVRTARTWRADVLVRETTAWAGWLAGDLLGIPVAVLDFAPTPPAVLAATVGEAFGAARSAVGLPPDPRLRTLNRWLHLLAAPPGWYRRPEFGPVSHLFQPPPDPIPPEAASPYGVSGESRRPLVYVSLGTKFNGAPGLFEKIFEGLGGDDLDVIATVGADRPLDMDIPANITVREFVPQGLILPHADAVICHAGYGTVMGALRLGKPVVGIPLAADAPANAARLGATGAGVAMTAEQVSAPRIRRAVLSVLTEPAYRARAAELARAASALPPLSEAAVLVERLVLDREPIRSAG